jgi:signal transduction histidine kinase
VPSCAKFASAGAPGPDGDAGFGRTQLETALDAQRLRLVRLFAIGLSVFATLGLIVFHAFGLLDGTLALAAVHLNLVLLALSGLASLLLCDRGRVRAATYVMILPLIGQGTLDLAVAANIDGPALITYFVALSMGALTVEGARLLLLGLTVTVGALAGVWLHCFPVVEQIVLPPSITVPWMMLAIPLGLIYPCGLFWLFGSYLRASQAEAWELAQRAERANRLKTDFLNAMSHDLRSPLHVIIGNVQILLEENPGGRSPEEFLLLDRVRRYGLDLLSLIESCLQVARLEGGRIPIHIERFRPADLVAEVLETFSSTPLPNGVSLAAIVAEDAPEMSTDRMKLKEVVQNLTGNAIKFTPRGHVEIRALPAGSDLLIEVADTGIGIPPDDLPLIFESFHQARPDDARLGGVGLGLYIVKHLTELLCGTVGAESRVGQGSTFRVLVPVRYPTARESMAGGHEPEPNPA